MKYGQTVHAGQLIAGRYRLAERIGAGGMGVVWRATDEQLGRPVAVKHVRIEDDERAARVMQREARIAAGLRHPNIVVLFDVVVEGADRCLIMEYLPSRNLAEVLEERGRLEPRAVAGIGAQLADALHAVHTSGIVHSDVKPSNVLVAGSGPDEEVTVKLTDFGVSWTISGDATLTDTGLIRGTPAYLSPEVAGGAEATPAADMFSLGATLYAAVEGAPPYGTGTNSLALLRKAAVGKFRPSQYAGPLAPVLNGLLARDPAARLTAKDARDQLRAVAAGGTVRPVRRRRRRLIVVGTAAVICAATATAVAQTTGGGGGNHRSTRQTAGTLGDPRTVDPCALTQAAPLRQYGETETNAHYGNFDRCDVLVQPATGPEMDVELQLQEPGPPPDEPAKAVGTNGVKLIKQAEQDGECDRLVLLRDGNGLDIAARQPSGGKVDLCAAANIAANSAISVLNHGPVPRRALPAASLARLKACDLVSPAAFAKAAGFSAANHESGFADWTCRWSDDSGSTSVILRFDQDQSQVPDGRRERLAGRTAYVAANDDGDNTCVARVVYRLLSDPDGQPTREQLYVEVQGEKSGQALCTPTNNLAAAAAAKLPNP